MFTINIKEEGNDVLELLYCLNSTKALLNHSLFLLLRLASIIWVFWQYIAWVWPARPGSECRSNTIPSHPSTYQLALFIKHYFFRFLNLCLKCADALVVWRWCASGQKILQLERYLNMHTMNKLSQFLRSAFQDLINLIRFFANLDLLQFCLL